MLQKDVTNIVVLLWRKYGRIEIQTVQWKRTSRIRAYLIDKSQNGSIQYRSKIRVLWKCVLEQHVGSALKVSENLYCCQWGDSKAKVYEQFEVG